jgi:hypothetical protein
MSRTFIQVEGLGKRYRIGQGTIPVSNDPMNGITGYYIDGSGVAHGFLRTP